MLHTISVDDSIGYSGFFRCWHTYARLNARFGFTFDPCPHPLPPGFDGLTCEWGESNYVNAPFGTIAYCGKTVGFTAWVRKALAEWRKGKRVVIVFPLHRWLLDCSQRLAPRSRTSAKSAGLRLRTARRAPAAASKWQCSCWSLRTRPRCRPPVRSTEPERIAVIAAAIERILAEHRVISRFEVARQTGLTVRTVERCWGEAWNLVLQRRHALDAARAGSGR